MKVAELFHTGLTVSDLDRSIAFYRDLLGLELVSQWDSGEPYLRTVVGYPDAELRIALLRLPRGSVGASGHHIELLEYRAPRGVRGDARTFSRKTGGNGAANPTSRTGDDGNLVGKSHGARSVGTRSILSSADSARGGQ